MCPCFIEHSSELIMQSPGYNSSQPHILTLHPCFSNRYPALCALRGCPPIPLFLQGRTPRPLSRRLQMDASNLRRPPFHSCHPLQASSIHEKPSPYDPQGWMGDHEKFCLPRRLCRHLSKYGPLSSFVVSIVHTNVTYPSCLLHKTQPPYVPHGNPSFLPFQNSTAYRGYSDFERVVLGCGALVWIVAFRGGEETER